MEEISATLPISPELRRLIVDRIANNIIGNIGEHGHYLEPEDYKQLLIELLDRIAGSLDYIGAGKVELTPASPPLMINMEGINFNPNKE